MDTTVYFEDQVSISIEDGEVLKADSDSDSELAVSSDPRFGIFSSDRLMFQRLEEGNSDFEVLKRSFIGGMRDFGRNIDVVGIHKKNYGWRVMDDARMEAFKVFAMAVASRNCGDANIKYGWYGGSRDEIREILLYGFRRFENRSSSYGRGVYLSPANLPMESAKSSVADSDGLRHVLLCRVILGNPEEISLGSQEGQPSSMEFNSGVDNLSSPKKYIIWEPYMNTHILPAFIVTFHADSLTGVGSLRTPTSPHMSINGLMRHLKNYLSSSKMMLLKRHHHEYHKNNISRSVFIRNLRAIAGDDVLRAIVQGFK
ncbi:probable inactive poly [ADP-ribose] polymerase SRO2 [Cynara cardunculus var. scolymus]|uniref:Poly(ADP-ribose) polymerase, catalytic domain-containing protein n=1 Tax=Cynara cardunculus var. scolymus TaxID=59895 RepID=A0A124SG89_CYNCS|nr:probable inactive poly [ADP-ribose] polymerase SRO2 [Cynara cardunculus var. scolymus]XP_024991156.1 probable inactive poly [ADP-ribose] polymerase SRO2 [Cynara cardunculus var. scolymus]XP_024991157.1 probable inactive poly [ADP-ribose] polymerase SRO2 [Cynara cardunculus var. scolymus]XP_024991158.1 probable inactive poly [ADP-ribose] polymerase SRO2 [Cynara cardunculus var. scolymus]KVI05643.1 Poly(ADP-ribose) polymerase, catalytic domain-containing protein [Cynara cardunculus var. scolym